MNQCAIYWKDIIRANNIDISNKKEILFVEECISKWYKQVLNLLQKNISQRLHKNMEFDYYKIINNYHDKNIIEQINNMTTEKYNLPLCINPIILDILEILRKKVLDHNTLKNSDKKYKELIKKNRTKHKEKFKPVLDDFLERKAPYLRELEDFKIKTGYIDYSQLPSSSDGRSKRRSKKRSKRRSKNKVK